MAVAGRPLWMLRKKGVSQIIWFLIAFIIILVLLGIAFLIIDKGKTFGLDSLEKVFDNVMGRVNQ